MKSLPQHGRNRGAALLLVLWALLVLALAVAGLVRTLDRSFEEERARGIDFAALQLARSGLAVASHAAVLPGDPVLQRGAGPGRASVATLTYEEGLVPLNRLVADRNIDGLREILRRWEIPEDEAARFADCLADWIDRDRSVRLHGAEAEEYAARGLQGLPPNRPLDSLEELLQIPGFEVIAAARPDWRSLFTLVETGKVHPGTASPEVLEFVAGLTQGGAEGIVAWRAGADGMPGTADDAAFTDIEQVGVAAGLDDAGLKAVRGRLTLDTALVRAESTGYAGSATRTIRATISRNATTGTRFLAWNEAD